MKRYLLSLTLVALLAACSNKPEKPYSTWMADSEITRFPELWQVDFTDKPKWEYTLGLMAQSIFILSETDTSASNREKYYKYVKDFADQFVDSNGVVLTYKLSLYNLDRINGGKFLWQMWHKTGEEKYLKAVETLRSQLDTQPRTSEGGFWHKQIYPYQMWLDGLYMGEPFYAQCAQEFDKSADFDDVINQFLIVYRHTYDPRTGLNFHAWDESREQAWANKETGCSPHVWGRAMGWYFMALVDALDYIPEGHPRRHLLVDIIKKVGEGVKKAQEPSKKVWYQVMDEPNREGNYLEATCSSMFVYSFFKAVRKGYLPADPYLEVAQNGYQGILDNFIKEEKDGTISLTRCCAVAGLGGNPYRDGSFDYYINEKIRDNDPKGVGPFILASVEAESLPVGK
ncbi:MAG: glycoside hydrolase family 88 protein [Culturomica sp.]|jgi:unsaturated rhamnogalacturonyl hydrolase|nr:glycoside hydrolase family 88 protein [Culturomica sp.]